MNEGITKRLHISGLTSHISRDDLVKRFSSFGTVKALDGLGKLDANGDLRPYAYVTIESTKGQLAKCEPSLLHSLFLFRPRDCTHNRHLGLNLLSGTTWKGARLRIGEAKPDYGERYVRLLSFSIVHSLTYTFQDKARERTREASS